LITLLGDYEVVGGSVVGASVVGGAVVGGSVVGGSVVGGGAVVVGGAVVGGLVPGGVVLGGGVVPGGWVTPAGAGTPWTATGPDGEVVSVRLIGLMDWISPPTPDTSGRPPPVGVGGWIGMGVEEPGGNSNGGSGGKVEAVVEGESAKRLSPPAIVPGSAEWVGISMSAATAARPAAAMTRMISLALRIVPSG
jgi:hypothetical protein